MSTDPSSGGNFHEVVAMSFDVTEIETLKIFLRVPNQRMTS
jgi:hypothetical protein